MDYNEIAENILENYSTTYCQADVERVAKVLKEISRQTAHDILNEINRVVNKYQVKVNRDSYDDFGFIYMVVCGDISLTMHRLEKKYNVEIKDNEN